MQALGQARRLMIWLLIAAVGIAFADASVVALALTELYSAFETTIVGVSWVLTSYALAVAVVAVLLAISPRRGSPRIVVAAGAAVFTVGSIVAGASNGLGVLIVGRSVQGVGAALLLAGALPLMADLAGPRRSRRWFAVAGSVGTAVGPALGGVLTQAFTWRAIFFVQAPVVASAALVAFVHHARDERVDDVDESPRFRPGTAGLANVGFAFLFAALVGALFLSVLLVIDVWRYSPFGGAMLLCALPAGMAASRSATAAAPALRAGLGSVLLGLGLVGLGFVPGEQPLLAVLALASCGAGFELLHDVLDAAALPARVRTMRATAVSIGARHLGLVLGLVIIAPVLSPSVTDGVDRATLGATSEMLDTGLRLRDKLPIAWNLRTAIDEADRGQVPDLGREFDERGASDDNELGRTRDDLVDTVTDALTRSFRPGFVIAALLALAAGIPGVLIARGERGTSDAARRGRAVIGATGLGALGLASLVLPLVLGGADSGRYTAMDPCAAAPDPRPGGGLDAIGQRILLSALNGAACDLHTTREVVVLSIDPKSPYDVQWDRATIEGAVRAGAHRAIDDSVARDEIPGPIARLLRAAIDRTPVDKLLDALAAFG